ncbi:MAG: hypothetical protein B7Y48_00965 [Methylophilales bacterium 28-44-11]|nr:MAG: hypothetical protein B7Y48_00965 [Methylophilales bacterium 28-44-11]
MMTRLHTLCFDRNHWHKSLLFTILMVSICVVFSFLYNLHDSGLIKYGDNVWFQGDITRIYDNMTNRFSFGHYRANVHPIYSLLTYPPTFVLKKILANDAFAVKTVTIAIAIFWLISLYGLLRIMGCLKLDASVFALLGASSSAALFWLHVPETYALSSISIMFAVGLSAYTYQKKLPDWIYATVNAFSIGMTITNWMAGILSTLTTLPLKRAIRVFSYAVIIIVVLWGVQKFIFPTSAFFIGNSEEGTFIFAPSFERLISVLITFFSHTIVAPELQINEVNKFGWPLLSVQSSNIGSSGLLGWIATGLWLIILSLGVWALYTIQSFKAFKITVALTLLGQFTLHFIYGEETFLYTLNFLPLLIVLAATATLTRYRKIAILLSLTLMPILLVNNITQLKHAGDIASPAYINKLKSPELMSPDSLTP